MGIDGQSTSIDYNKARQAAETITSCSNTMATIFEEFGAELQAVGADDVFAGDASASLGERYRVLKTKFDSYTNKVREFSQAISSATDATQGMENKLENEADSLGA